MPKKVKKRDCREEKKKELFHSFQNGRSGEGETEMNQ